MSHYNLRLFELVLFATTLIYQASSLGLARGFTLSECYPWGGFRNFIITLIPNIFFVFWGLSMYVNFTSIQAQSRDLKKDRTNQKRVYLIMAGICAFFVFLNNAVVKYNFDVWCRDADNFALAREYLGEDGKVYRSVVHYLLTALNLTAYIGSVLFVVALGTHYDDSKR